jgi:hypothetical protein
VRPRPQLLYSPAGGDGRATDSVVVSESCYPLESPARYARTQVALCAWLAYAELLIVPLRGEMLVYVPGLRSKVHP